jgi:hypothetical protein
MAELVNDKREFIWYSWQSPPPMASNFHGAKATILDTGEMLIFDGSDWVPDKKLIYALTHLM